MTEETYLKAKKIFEEIGLCKSSLHALDKPNAEIEVRYIFTKNGTDDPEYKDFLYYQEEINEYLKVFYKQKIEKLLSKLKDI